MATYAHFCSRTYCSYRSCRCGRLPGHGHEELVVRWRCGELVCAHKGRGAGGEVQGRQGGHTTHLEAARGVAGVVTKFLAVCALWEEMDEIIWK